MENSTELVFILDRSGSMAGLEADTIGGYNAMLEKQRAVPGEARVTTVLFDNQYELLHDRIDVRAEENEFPPKLLLLAFHHGLDLCVIKRVGRVLHPICNNDENHLVRPIGLCRTLLSVANFFDCASDGIEQRR